MEAESVDKVMRDRVHSKVAESIFKFNVIDPFVKAQQDEWACLLQIHHEADSIPFEAHDIFGEVTHKYKCAAIWVMDAIHARAIDYPRSDQELDRLYWGRSEWVRSMFNVAALYQIVSPFMSRAVCNIIASEETGQNGWRWFNTGGEPTITALALFDIVCLGVFVFDLYLAIFVNFSRKSFLSKPWTTFRILGVIALFCGIISTFSGNYTTQLYLRCIFPFFMISRRNNLKLMLQGLLHSVYHTRNVLTALFGIIAIWGFLGFFLFRAVQEKGDRFSTPWNGMFTALHSFTSRPFSLLALNEIWNYDAFIASIYFVSLTLAADILCTAFIIAVGNRQYKLFATKVLSKRLLDRKKAVCAVWAGFATDKGFPLRAWEEICLEFKKTKYELDLYSINYIFHMQDVNKTGYVDIEGLFRLVGSVASRITFKRNKATKKKQNNSVETNHEGLFSQNSTRSDADVERIEMFIATKSEVPNPVHGQGDDGDDNNRAISTSSIDTTSTIGTPGWEATKRHSRANLRNEAVDDQDGTKDGEVIIVDSQEAQRRRKEKTKKSYNFLPKKMRSISTGGLSDSQRDDEPNSRGIRSKLRGQSVEVIASSYKVTSDPTLLIQGIEGSGNIIEIDNEENFPYELDQTYANFAPYIGDCMASLLVDIIYCLRSIFDFQMVISVPAKNPCVAVLEYEDIYNYRDKYNRYSVPVYNTIFIAVVHVLLIVDLTYISDPKGDKSWYDFGWVLQVVFIIDMLAKFAIYGHKGLGRSKITRWSDIVINVVSLFTFLALYDEYNGKWGSDASQRPSKTLTTVIIVQSMRLFKLFFVFNDQDIFEDILPTVFRAIFILFSVIYFFSVFAHGFFCNSLCAECANVQDADDDSPNWVQFSEILNFDTFLQSLFTMFELALLGNWSVVMDAAAKVTGIRAYFFFYIYRVVLTLCVVPILVSFMMNSFISAVIKGEVRHKVKKEEEINNNRTLKALGMDFGEDTTIKEEKEALARHLLNTGGNNDDFDGRDSVSVDSTTGDDEDFRRETSKARPRAKTRASVFDSMSFMASSGWLALPGISFQGRSRNHKEEYGVSTRYNPSTGPSMVNLWSSEDPALQPKLSSASQSTTPRMSNASVVSTAMSQSMGARVDLIPSAEVQSPRSSKISTKGLLTQSDIDTKEVRQLKERLSQMEEELKKKSRALDELRKK